jgi:hypothetical protein
MCELFVQASNDMKETAAMSDGNVDVVEVDVVVGQEEKEVEAMYSRRCRVVLLFLLSLPPPPLMLVLLVLGMQVTPFIHRERNSVCSEGW